MFRKHSVFIVLFFVVLFGSLLLTQEAIGSESGISRINSFAFVQNVAIEDNTGTTLTPVPDMQVSFRGRNHALIRFCAEGNMFGTGTGSTRVSAILDGTQVGDEIQFFTSNDFNVVPRCYEWVTEDLATGTHTATIFWRLTTASGATLTGRFHDSVLTVFYR